MIQKRHFQPEEDSLIFNYTGNMEIFHAVLGNIEYAPGVSSLNNTAIDTAIQSVLLNKNDSEIQENFQRLAEMGVFTFKMNQAKTGTFKATVSGKEYELPAKHDGAYLTATDWLSYLQCATLAGHKPSIDYLLSLTYNDFTLSVADFISLDQAIVESYRSIYLDSENEEEIVELIAMVEQRAEHPYIRDYILPPLLVYKAFFTKRDDLIDEAIVNALNKHINYWSTEEKKYGSRGWISVPLISVLVHKGFKTTVKSEYLPENIIP